MPVRSFFIGLSALCLLILAGCATPQQTVSRTRTVSPDANDNLGGTGAESDDVRTIAARMTPSLLSIPEIAQTDQPVRIAVEPIRNSTRFMIDREIFTTRLRAELNKVSNGRVRFFAQDLAQDTRAEMLRERERQQWESAIDAAARIFTEGLRQLGGDKPVRLAVTSATGTHVSAVDGDALLSMVRSRMVELDPAGLRFLERERSGKVTSPVLAEQEANRLGLLSEGSAEAPQSAEFFLTGELFAQNLATPTEQPTGNETLNMNLRVVRVATGAAEFERTIPVTSRITRGIERARYLLSGEMRGISKAAGAGDRSDYILFSFQLIDPVSNELVWEDIYETKKVSNTGVLYR